MYDVSIFLEHVDLLDCLDGLNIELLERRLQLLVVRARALVDLLHLSPGRTLSPMIQGCLLDTEITNRHKTALVKSFQEVR